MKKIFKYAMLFVAALSMSMGMSSCSDDDDNKIDVAEQNSEIQSLTNKYVNDVIYPTYSNLATQTETLYTQISALKTKLKAGTTVKQSEIDAICTTYKVARDYWEKSEAYLYGAASDFEIDPHIDTWPLDVPTLAKDLQDDAKIAKLDASDGIEYARTYLTPENLGFHGIEFIFFRDGKNRDVAIFNNDATEDDANFSGMNVTGKEEVIFATAVAGDLRDKCYQLEVSWLGSSANASHIARVAECAKTSDDFSTTVAKTGSSYGEYVLASGTTSGMGATWKKMVEIMLIDGCSNICAEVADQKMGQAYRCATGSAEDEDDPNYIESPYSHNSFTDFKGNILSIKYSLYGQVSDGSSYASNSLMAYLTKYNSDMASLLNTKLNAALTALDACQNSGKAFVEAPGATCVGTAISAIGELDDALTQASNWILQN